MQIQNSLKLREALLRFAWYAKDARFDIGQKCLPIHIDFVTGRRFAYPSIDGAHPVDDTHLNDRRV